MKTTEPAALNRMREIGDKLTPEEAARIIREHYERPDPAVANDARRMEVARRVYDGRSERPIKKAGAADDAAETARDALHDEGDFFSEDPVRDAETLKKKPRILQEENIKDPARDSSFGQQEEGVKDIAGDTITPEELAKRLEDVDRDSFRMYDEADYQRFRDLPEDAQRAATRKNIAELQKGIQDPLGNTVKVILEDRNLNALDEVANVFASGHASEGKPHSFNSRRAYVTKLIKHVIAEPDIITRQAGNGNPSYLVFWRGMNKDMTHAVIVTVDKNHNGKIITSFINADRGKSSAHAIAGMKSQIKKADAVLCVSRALHERPSKYLRRPSGARDSTLDTQLHPSGNSSISNSNKSGNIKIQTGSYDKAA